MADYKVVDAQQLDGDLTVLADAIRERAGSEGKMAFPHGMAQMVKSIPTGGVTLPTLENPVTEAEVFLGKEYINGSGQKETGSFSLDDEMMEQDALILQISNALRNKVSSNNSGTLPPLENPAASSDMATGKELYDQDGNVVTGTLPDLTDGAAIFANSTHEVGGTKGGNTFNVAAVYSNTAVQGVIVRPSARLGIRSVPTSLLGDATAAQVAKGATFTSAAGYLMEGTHECEGGVTLPELGDTAAQPTDMAAGKVLYDDAGNPVTGTLGEATEGILINSKSDAVLGGSAGAPEFNVSGIYLESAIGDNTKGVIMRPGSRMAVRNVPTSLFGNATPNQVAKGATFTSAAGLLMEGTMEAASGSGLAVSKGNTSSPTIETGLSSIDYFVLMATGFSRAGLMQLLYRKPNNAISYILCTSYSYSTMKTELNHASMASSTLFTIDGGTVTWNGTGTSAFMSGESYMWLAFGTE